MKPLDRLFIGIRSAGIVYADRTVEVDGDYKRLAFLPYDTLVVKIEHGCPPDLLDLILDDVRQYRPGQTFRTSACGQSVVLGCYIDF